MTGELVAVAAPKIVYRIGRAPDPWTWPDWRHATDGTFGNRYDDPQGQYRVLYASSQRAGAFIETLARFRPDPAVVAESIGEDPRDRGHATVPPGRVPRSWATDRRIGTARLNGRFCDIGHSASLAHLRSALAHRLVHYELDDLDAAALRLRAPRGFTQELSRLVFERSDEGERAFDGIRYRSRLGDDIDNWAIFEPAQLHDTTSEPISADHSDLVMVVDLFHLTFA